VDMKTFFAAIIAVAANVCGPSPLEACKAAGAAQCKKMWTCDSALKLGDDEASCVETQNAFCKMVQDGKCPNSDKAFDAAAAEQCAADTNAATCEQYKADGFNPASCQKASCE
jgi:hypothetical protein